MKENRINYENYKNHKEKYGHVSTWSLWNEEILGIRPRELDEDYAIRKELLSLTPKQNIKKKA